MGEMIWPKLHPVTMLPA